MKTSIKSVLLIIGKAIALYIIFVGAFGMTIQSWPILLVGMIFLFFINVGTFAVAQEVAKEFSKEAKPNPPTE